MNPLLFLRQRRRPAGGVEINVISLIDILFVLLVFFMVTTSFTADSTVDIERPGSAQARPAETGEVLLVALTASGAVVLPGGAHGDAPGALAAALQRSGAKRVLLVADRQVSTGRMLEVMDACTAAGAERVELAAQAKETP